VSAISHDHGPDVTKAIRLVAIHSFLCVDHELDLTVNKGIDCLAFHALFEKAYCIVSTVRGSNNLYRRLRDEQVDRVASSFILLCRSLCAFFMRSLICGHGNVCRW
jgi:hypothetical protein